MQVNNEFKPTIVAFCCNWCSYAGADLAGTNRLSYPADVKIIRVPCSCRVNPLFILRAFERGADGVYLFNFFEENHDSSFEFSDGKLQNCFQERLKAAREPDKLPQRLVHIGGTAKRYPIVLHPGESYTWACGQQGFYRVLVGLDADVPLTANGVILESEPVYPGFDIQSGKGRPSEFVYALTQVAPYVKSAALTGDIIIQNNTSEPANILWLEIRI